MQPWTGTLPPPHAGRAETVRLAPDQPHRPRRRGLALGVSTTALAAAAMLAPPAVGRSALVEVVVTGADTAAAAAAVQQAGGTVVAALPLIHAVDARIPQGALLPPTFTVTPDRAVTVTADGEPPAGPAPTVRATLGLPAAGTEGTGTTVAVVDTGVADVPDLGGRVVAHLDLTGTGGGDGYGHGTFMAGLIAGDGAGDGGATLGVSPGARVLDVKVARSDGSTDLGTVLRGLQAVADSGRRYGVDVVNLSLSSASPVPYQVDPLNQALRALWRTGITVVVPAGNGGPAPGSVESPGNDPVLLTVGAVDEHGTALRDDDSVPGFSGRGPTRQSVAKPDLVAPGMSLTGLRDPGSVIDVSCPSARIGDGYFRGSGTSMATAVVSGVVADVLAHDPRLTPDDVKALLRGTAYRAPGLTDPASAGAGGVDAAAALAVTSVRTTGRHQAQDAAPGDPGTWKALAEAFARGDAAAAQAAWDRLAPQARSWAARSWASLDAAAQEWVARSWAARSWAGTGVSPQEWAARSWAARSWAGDDWAARSWAARSWAARSWAGDDWAGDDWAARSWAARSWAARSWAALWR
ncbi:MAG TPA: S8 family serine peptidase [Kineosporiaceae bacterium]